MTNEEAHKLYLRDSKDLWIEYNRTLQEYAISSLANGHDADKEHLFQQAQYEYMLHRYLWTQDFINNERHLT